MKRLSVGQGTWPLRIGLSVSFLSAALAILLTSALPVVDFDALPLLSALRCPVLAQVGGADPKNDGPAALERIRAALHRGGNTRFTGVSYPRAGHGMIEWRLPFRLPPPWLAAGYLRTQLDWVRAQNGLTPRGARVRSAGIRPRTEPGD